MKNLKIFYSLVAFGACMLISNFASAQFEPRPGDGIYTLYEGNNGTQNQVIQLSSELPGDINLKYFNGKNDEARSVGLLNIPANRTLIVFDDPNGGTGDDYCEIHVKTATPSGVNVIVNSFQTSYEDTYVKVTYHSHNGLDGKVSHTRVDTF